MIAMAVSDTVGRLDLVEREVPSPAAQEVLVRVRACGVCRTDLHVVDRDLPGVRPGLIPGHEIVGVIERLGADVTGLNRSACRRTRFTYLRTCLFADGPKICATQASPATRAMQDTERHRRQSLLLPLPEGYGDASRPLLCAG